MRVVFSHGKETGPWGRKISALAEVARNCGLSVDSVDYRGTEDPDHRVQQLIAILQGLDEPVVLVGSSMGGYVAVVAAEHVATEGLFLLAPALYREGYARQSYNPNVHHIEIVHGWSDEVIAYESSVRFAQAADCTLHLVNGDHGLTDALPEIIPLFESFLTRLLARHRI